VGKAERSHSAKVKGHARLGRLEAAETALLAMRVTARSPCPTRPCMEVNVEAADDRVAVHPVAERPSHGCGCERCLEGARARPTHIASRTAVSRRGHTTQLTPPPRHVNAGARLMRWVSAGTQWERLEAMLRRTHDAGAATTVHQYDGLVSAHMKAQRWQELYRVMRQLRAAGKQQTASKPTRRFPLGTTPLNQRLGLPHRRYTARGARSVVSSGVTASGMQEWVREG
jgi:hypothetical protein